ncbi:hypothetical protein R84B8_00524 [Treponema sp. R8-4-B8]
MTIIHGILSKEDNDKEKYPTYNSMQCEKISQQSKINFEYLFYRL